MTTKLGVLLSSSATHSTVRLLFRVRGSPFNPFQACTLGPPCGEEYAGVTLINASFSLIALARLPYLTLFLLSLCPLRFSTNRP